VRPPAGARAAAVHAGFLFVLFGGATEDAFRLIDIHDTDGNYSRSLRMGWRAEAIGLSDGLLYLISTADRADGEGGQAYPAIVAVRIPSR
jgi:hypothetical protein